MGLYRPTVTRTRKDGTKYREKSRYWWGSFRHPVSGTSVRLSLKTADKSAAQTLLRDAERRAALEAAGLIDPFEKHQQRPLTGHLDDWKAALAAKGNTPRHVELVVSRARKLVEACGFRFWRDVSASRVQTHLGDLRTAGRSPQTRNFYLQAIKQFCRWMVQDGRAATSPVTHLSGENVKTDRRHDRRALEPDELRWLLRTTRNGPTNWGMSGPDRATLYQLAVETGLRASELRSLTWGDLDLDGDAPTVTVRAAYSKRRREDTLPLRPSTVSMLKEHSSRGRDVSRNAPLFGLPSASGIVRMLRTDLQAARDAWIEAAPTDAARAERNASTFLTYKDRDGRAADFHALRHTFITNLVRGGVQPKVAQQLARHSTITLTMDRYSHVLAQEQADALLSLPDLADPPPLPIRATGTDNR